MFRENKDHLQQELFNSYSWMNPKVQASLQGTWAPLFYEHVFCKIDETPFSYLYSLDNGRPNFPVNILLSLEFIKHMKDYTDEDILEFKQIARFFKGGIRKKATEIVNNNNQGVIAPIC